MPLSATLRALLRPRFLIPLLAATLAGASVGRFAPPRYRAVAVLSVEGDPAPGGSLEDEIFARPHLEMLIAHLDPYPGTADALERLRYDFAVRVSGPQMLALEYEHRDPRKAADVVNKLAGRLAEPAAPTPAQGDSLDARLAEARRELDQKEEDRRRFQESHAASSQEQGEASSAALERLRAERQAVESKRQEAQAAHDAVVAREEAAAASAQADPDSKARERLRADLAELRNRYTEDHPDIKKLRAQLAELEGRAPAPRPAATPAGVPAGLQALREQVRALDARISDAEAGLEQTERPAQRDDAVAAELEAAKKRYLELLNQRMSGHLEKPGGEVRGTTLSFRVRTPARPPEHPFSPDRRAFLLGGLALGLIIGIALTIRAERRREELAFEPPKPAPARKARPLPPSPPPFDIDLGEARARAKQAAPPATAPPSDMPATPDFSALLETAVIPAGPAAMPASTTAPDLLEPGSIFWRTPRPARTSVIAEEAREPAPAAEARPPEPAATPAEDAPETLLEPGSIFWHRPHDSAADTLPGLGRNREPLLGDESEVVPREPSEPAAPVVEPPPPTVEPPPVEPPPVAPIPPKIEPPPVEPTPPKIEPPPVEPPPAVDEALPTVALPEVPLSPAPAAVLSGPSLVVTGASRETVLALPASASERLIGAAAYCHLRLDLPNVDPVHARVASDTYGLSLADAGSTAGTFVNGRRIAGRYPLKDGDQVSLGPPGFSQSASLLVRLPPVERAPVARDPAPPVAPREAPTPTDSARALAKALIPPPPRTPPTPRPRVASPPPARPAGLAPPTRRGRRAGDRRGLAVAAALLTVVAGGVAAWNGLLRSAPALAEVAPRRARPGQTLALSGSGFEAAPEQNTVRVGSALARVVSARPDRLEVTLPRALGVRLPATLPVFVEVDGRRSSPLTVDVAAAPRVTGLQPEVARAGETVTASLEPKTARAESVHVAGIAAELVGSEPGAVRFTVPTLADAARVPVDVWIAGEPAEHAYLAVGRLPLVAEVLPPRGPVGERVALRGFGFDPDPNGNRVHFGKAEALVLSSAPGELIVSAPPAERGLAGHVELPISVTAHGATSSSPAHYTLVGQPSGPFLPRFFAAPVPELAGQYHALVSTELGPVMLLTSPAGDPSTALRAARVARVLNELVEAAAKPLALAFEVEPVPAVTVAGGSHLVATATPADALGYEGLWARLGRRGRATPHSVATFWTALLRDYLALFVQHQRPTHVLELSARGQVFADLYAQSAATPAGRKEVSTELVSRLQRPLVDAIREMALLLPQPGESNPGASVVGRWLGSMEEGDRGAQPIQVRLFFEGRRLAGSLTRRARGVTGEMRLRDVVYDSGSLAFSLPAGAAALRFSGTVREDAMAGLISSGPDGRRTVGFFTLRFAE